MTCLGEQFGITCPSAFLKILKLVEQNKGNLKIFQNHKSDLSPKLPGPKMWVLVNRTKPINTLYLNWYLLTAGNYKSVSRQLQNNTVNSAMSKTTNCVINCIA